MVTGSECTTNAQKALDMIYHKSQELGLKINYDKTKCMEFRMPRAKYQIHNQYRGFYEKEVIYNAGGHALETVSQFKYLGVVITSNLSINAHIDHIISKASRKLYLLNGIAGATWGCKTETCIKYCNVAIRPILEYGAQYLFTYVNVTNGNHMGSVFEKIEAFYRKCLRTALGLPPNTPNNYVYSESGCEPICNRISKLTINTITRIREYDLPHPLKPDIKAFWQRYGPHYVGTLPKNSSKSLLDSVSFFTKDIPHYAEYMLHTDANPTRLDYFNREKLRKSFEIIPLPDKKSNISSQDRPREKEVYDLLLESYTNSLIMFTDGSVSNDQPSSPRNITAESTHTDSSGNYAHHVLLENSPSLRPMVSRLIPLTI